MVSKASSYVSLDALEFGSLPRHLINFLGCVAVKVSPNELPAISENGHVPRASLPSNYFVYRQAAINTELMLCLCDHGPAYDVHSTDNVIGLPALKSFHN